MPLIFILVVRLKKLSHILVLVFRDSNGPARRHSAAGRVFKDLGEAFLALLLFLLFLPFLPSIENLGLMLMIVIIFLAILMTYPLWDAYKAAYRKVSSSIVKGVSEREEKKQE